jgi:hypothetical protein
VYPIGIPCYFFYLLYKNRKNLTQISVRASLGFLFDAYDTQFWFYELIDQGHKLFLTSLLAFFPFDLKLPAGMCVAGLYCLSLLLFNPFVRVNDDRMILLAQFELSNILMCGYILQIYGFPEPNGFQDIALSVVLIILVLCVVAIFFYHGMLYVRKALWDMRRTVVKHRSSLSVSQNNKRKASDSDEGRVSIDSTTATIAIDNATTTQI